MRLEGAFFIALVAACLKDHCRFESHCTKLRLLKKQFPIQDPMWTSWGPWGKCSMTCGLGHKRKYRKCEDHVTGEEAKPGLDCLGGSTELVEDCKAKDCPGM